MRPCTLCSAEGKFWDTLDGRPPMRLWEEPPEFYWTECPRYLGTGQEPPPRVRKGGRGSASWPCAQEGGGGARER